MSGKRKRTGHIVSHTHWDREWRYPIWETRLMLIDFMDELVEILESGKYPSFLLDGQVTPVVDYLESRPGMTERVKALIKEGKLLIGPWLILPDEYPIDGESMVRNLLLGTRKGDELGGHFKVGYTPFGWGQTGQLPQIYAGFGIDVAMIGKRVNKKRAPQCEFIWKGPDGSEMLSTRFGELGRQNFYFKIHLSSLFGVYHEGPDWKYEWGKGGVGYHRADIEQMEQDHFNADAPKKWYPETITPELIEEAWATMDESVLGDDRLMMNGCDYTAAQPMFPEMLARINEVDPDPDREWVHTTMVDYVEMVKEKIDRSKLAVVEGELRDGPVNQMTGNALSTRLYVKQLNKKAQNLLIRFAEPLSVLAAMDGAPLLTPLIDKAWQLLLESHPHDSINGVTQDKTVIDVVSRLNHVIDISQTLANRAMQQLVSNIDTSAFGDDDVLVTVFNPLPYGRREILEAWIDMPYPELGENTEFIGPPTGLQMFDADGNPISTQWEGYSQEVYPTAEIHTRCRPYKCYRHRVFFDTGEIPAGGYKIFRAGESSDTPPDGIEWNNSAARTSTILKSPNVMENKFLRVEMNGNGTFDLTDKRLDNTYRGLNYYQDSGEHGDYWINKKPMFNQVHTSQGCNARIWSEEAGPLQATLVSEITMKLPSRGDETGQRRGENIVDLTIRTAVTLRAGGEQVDVKVSFENRCENHYLRAMFPTGLAGAVNADTGGHFNVDSRPIKPQGPTETSAWPDMATLPMNNFLDVSDGQSGLAFLTDSLTEYEVMDNEERTVGLSLLRAVKNWICTEGRCGSTYPMQKGGQCLGEHELRYSIRPHSGNWQEANVPLAAEKFNVPPCPVQTRANDGTLPAAEGSLFEIENSAMRFSTIKKAQDRDTFVVRLYNPTGDVQKGGIRFAAGIEAAWLTNLNEQQIEQIELTDKNTVSVVAEPKKIVTIEIQIKNSN